MQSPWRVRALCVLTGIGLFACDRVVPPAPPLPARSNATSALRVADMGAELHRFDRDVVERLRRLPEAARTEEEQAAVARGTTLNEPARQSDVDALAARIGKPLPPSYRDFLVSSDGMLFEGALNVVPLLPAASVVPLTDSRYPGLGIWRAMPDVAIPLDPAAGGPLPGAALARAWLLSSIVDGDVYLIFPELAGPDGEWPVWFFGPKSPGAIGYPSFGAMLVRERDAALRVLEMRAQRAR
ncbi:MAG: SMI1/KNR4 family protein [Betaproteobacteria bacterium]